MPVRSLQSEKKIYLSKQLASTRKRTKVLVRGTCVTVDGFHIFRRGVRDDQSFHPKQLGFQHNDLYRKKHGGEACAEDLREYTKVRARQQNEDLILRQLIDEKWPPTPTPLPAMPTPLRLPTGQRPVFAPDSVLVLQWSRFDSPGPEGRPSRIPSARPLTGGSLPRGASTPETSFRRSHAGIVVIREIT